MARIVAEDLTLVLPLYTESNSLRSFLKDVKNKKKEKNVTLLNGLNFSLEHGDRLGLIGHNGAGKSTLLRVLSGIYQPTSGKLSIDGFIVPLLDISLGLDENLTGRQNIRLKGLFLNQGNDWLVKNEQAIIDFSELSDHIDKPVKSYSSGMKMRLAFSISMSIDADILLLDEVMAVGDIRFQIKAKEKIKEVTSKSGIVVMALHSSPAIMEMCNKAIWVENGHIRMSGESHEVVRAYDDFMHGRA
ncbi:ABC transporter ATP-binding protein [Dickeya oryzae]|uniref:ABC transporter ATP-binding protein n=1 Tax=Dickeya oryzae TaxID=1240404 RepID=UPI001AECE26F|nr:ABC transporter ATP-binding protein [Dickeya oryzae]MBP2848016.1 ABC transporter ATP-binding protein [Dickeya oryzae]